MTEAIQRSSWLHSSAEWSLAVVGANNRAISRDGLGRPLPVENGPAVDQGGPPCATESISRRSAYSGGNLDRPALQRLIKDLHAEMVDVVVVYKIDRLTRFC